MIELNPINELMTTGEIKKPSTSPQPSKNLRGNQIRIYGLDTAN